MFLVLKIGGRIETWLGRFLSSGGRLILTNSCLSSLLMIVMGLFLLQDGVHMRFDSHRARFFWEGAGPKRKYHLVNWPNVCRPKECGGLGILNTKKMNVALLLKWIWRLYHEEDAMWVQILRAKYPEASDFFAGNGQGGSQFWKSLHKIKHIFKLGARHTVVDGRRTLFWLDNWHHLGVLKDAFPALFAICDNESVSVAQACGEPQGIRLRRALDRTLRGDWEALVEVMDSTRLAEGNDRIGWSLEPSGTFSVNSMYAKLAEGASVAHFKDIWAAKLPLKIRIFTRQLALNRLPTSVLISARHGPGTGRCSLCGEVEDASHIFFNCSMAKNLWAVTRQLLGCNWSPANFPQFYSLVSSLLGRHKRTTPFSQHNPEPFGALETSLQLSLKSFVIPLILFIKSRYSCSCGS
jgi:hypothetical protein